MRKLILSLLLITLAILPTTLGQDKPLPWPEWSKKEALQILNDSPWGQTQVQTDLSEMFFRPQADPNVAPRANDPNRDRQGSTNQATSVKYRIRFLSATPIRLAFARLITMDQKTQASIVTAQLRDFVERKFDQWIAVSVDYESNDQRFSGEALQVFNSATTASLKNTTYLERKDGKRLFLHAYYPPSSDGLGAKFIFERIVDEAPFLKRESGDVRFVSEMSKTLKLDKRFKVADMIYEGKLEY